MKITLWKRLLRGPAASTPGQREPVYTYRFTLHQHVHTRKTTFTNADDARRKAQAHIRSLELGVHDQVANLFSQRTANAARRATVAELLEIQTRLAPGLMRPESAHSARLQLLNILRRALGSTGDPPVVSGDPPETLPLTRLDAALVRRYADAILRAAVAQGASERRVLQMQRSANSTHASACVLFTRKMRTRYADAGLVLPPTLEGFTKAPPFPHIDALIEYNIPADHIIAATFKNLEDVQRTTNPNLYCAIWLALGFGLRKGEIFGARVRDIQPRQGKIIFTITETWVARRKRDTTKNDSQPVIQEANGAWTKLQPFITGRAPDDYILTGPHHSARTEYVARDVSTWMRALGWGTQKTLHAWRAYAIAQVVLQTRNLKTASLWARHSSVLTTEKCYGHFLKLDVESVPLTFPTPAAPFRPELVTTAVSGETSTVQVVNP